MLFSSITFLFYFLPVFLICYFIVPKKFANAVLLLGSLFFYAWGEPRYLLLMVMMICAGYFFGIWIQKITTPGSRKLVTALSVAFCLVVLGFFKYTDFLLENINRLPGLSVSLLSVTLPIGISFYTFQIISYLLDVSHKKVSAQKNFLCLAVYIAMFPQLIAGPIVRYRDIEKQLTERTVTVSEISCGIRRFVIGLCKKLILANTLGEIGNLYRETSQVTVVFVWLYAIAATLQIYFDFSGYSDMAIGLGKIMGFELPENFDYPLASCSITDFWHRWHMTLGGFFRDYLYIPLGGNRVPVLKWIRNILIVWMATGLWHGAAWTFVVWGMFFAFFLVIEKTVKKAILKNEKVLPKQIPGIVLCRHIYVWLLLCISFVIFNATDLSDAFTTLKYMSGAGHISLVSAESLFYFRDYFFILLIAVVIACGFFRYLTDFLRQYQTGERVLNIVEPILLATGFLICVAYLINGSYNPFLYFRF